MKLRSLLAVCAGLGVCGAAQAVDIKAGDWTLSISGIINAYYTYASCSGDRVGGLALADRGLGCNGHDAQTTIGNGLLPNFLQVTAKSREGGFDIEGTIGIGTAVSTTTNSAIKENTGVDVRKGYLTIGNKDMGTFKVGRDYGYFGQDVILSDMTLLGLGEVTQATQQGRVSLGHIGGGYKYLNNYGMIAYTTPDLSGFKGTLALVDPTDSGVVGQRTSTPQVQANGSYGGKFDGGSWRVWASGLYQHFDIGQGTLARTSFNTQGYEVGGTVSFGPLSVVGNYEGGNGIGILSEGDEGDIKSQHYFGQVTWKMTDTVKVGVNYGKSKDQDDPGPVLAHFQSNENWTVGIYWSVVPAITLVAEGGQTKSKDLLGDEARQDGGGVGAIMFF